jgi:hypothetical protein
MWIAAENLRNELIRTLGIIIAHQLFTRSQSSNSIIYAEQTRVWPHDGGGETGPCSQRPQNAGAQKRLPRCGCGCCIQLIYIYSHSPEFLVAACESKSNGPFSLSVFCAPREGWADLPAINSVEVRFSIKKRAKPHYSLVHIGSHLYTCRYPGRTKHLKTQLSWS